MIQNKVSPSSNNSCTSSVVLDAKVSLELQSLQSVQSLIFGSFVKQQLYLKFVAVLITFETRVEYMCEML